MRFCEAPNCNNPVFSTCKISGKGYCRNHQYMKDSFDRRSILQRGIDKHKEQQKTKKRKPGWFDETETSLSNEDLVLGGHLSVLGSEGIYKYLENNPPKIYHKDNVGMDMFWVIAAKTIAKTERCWECNEYISKYDYRNSTGHIFPKSLFPSVADNIWNFVIVGNRCGCHHKTHTLATFSQMSIFPVAVQRYMKFGHLITEKHKYLDLFIEYANQTI